MMSSLETLGLFIIGPVNNISNVPEYAQTVEYSTQMSPTDSIHSLIQSTKCPGNGLYWAFVNFIFMDLVLYI